MAEQKTIGQIAFDIRQDYYNSVRISKFPRQVFNEQPIYIRNGEEAAASAVWDQAVEACIEALKENAQLTKEHEADIPGYVFASVKRQHWGQAAESLRSLKRSDKTESDNGGCQASAGAEGDTVSDAPLHSDIIAEAIRKVSWHPEAFHVRCDENGQIFVSADGQPIMDFTARVALELGEALVTLAANAKSSIEERSETERAANSESSLTHKPLPPSPEEENGDV